MKPYLVPRCFDGHLHSGYAPLYSQQSYETAAKRDFVRGYTLIVGSSARPWELRARAIAAWGVDG